MLVMAETEKMRLNSARSGCRSCCEGVSAGEVAEIARSCELDAVYFLSGEDEEAEAE